MSRKYFTELENELDEDDDTHLGVTSRKRRTVEYLNELAAEHDHI